MSSTKKLERGWYSLQFFFDLIPIYPVYAVMMAEGGITPIELSLLFIIWSGSVVVLEVPLGVLGDRMPRKQLVLVSCVLKSISFSIWLTIPNFFGFMVGFICWGVGDTIMSGTIQALLYDGLSKNDEQMRFTRIYSRGSAIGETGVALALLLGGVISQWLGYSAALMLSIASPLVAALLAWQLLPNLEVHETARRESYIRTLQSGWKHAIGRRLILYIIVLFAGVGTFYSVFEEYVGPFLREREFSLVMIGIVTAGYQGCRAAGMWMAGRLPEFQLRHMNFLYLAGAVCLILMPIGGDIAMVVMLSMFVISFAVVEIILETRLQHAIESHARATVTSVVNTAREIVGILYYLLIGLMATATSWHDMTIALAIACLGLIMIVSLMGYRWRI